MTDHTAYLQTKIETGQEVPEGEYDIYAPLTLSPGKALTGAGRYFDMNSQSLHGTVINVRFGDGPGAAEQSNRAALRMGPGTSVSKVAFNYPSQGQAMSTPHEYPPTIAMLPAPGALANPYHGDVHIRDVMLYKSYVGIDARGDDIGKFITTHRYHDVLMSALWRGVRMSNVTDWCVLDTIEQQPGFIGHMLDLRHWVQSNGVFLDLSGKVDWLQMDKCMSWATALGANAKDVYGPLSFANCDFDGSLVSFYIDGNCIDMDAKFNNCTFTCFNALTGLQPGFVVVANPNSHARDVIFNACHLFGPSNGWAWMGNPDTSLRRLILNATTTDVHGQPTYAIHTGADMDQLVLTSNILKGVSGLVTGSPATVVDANNLVL